jgi:acyl-CoA dehydrogenase
VEIHKSRWLELSRTLGERLGVERSPGDEKTFTDAILRQMAKDRLIWAMAPKDLGGEGLSLGETASITCDVARLSGSAGLIYAMHASQALTLVRHADQSHHLHALTRRLVSDQLLVASGTSEKGVGGDIFGSRCRLEATESGRFKLLKESPNVSYLDLAGAILITGVLPAQEGKEVQVLVAASKDEVESEPGTVAHFMGMRGILNCPYVLRASFGEEAIFAESYPSIARATMTPTVHILWAALWCGLAGHVLDKVKRLSGKEYGAETEMASVVRFELSRLVDKHYQMNALVRDAVTNFDTAPSEAATGIVQTARIKRLKTTCSALLSEICVEALDLLGIRGYAEAGPLSVAEPIRDAFSARVMISNYRLLTANAKVERFINEGLSN